MKIVCISDTHCRLKKIKVPEGDLLLHAGDLTFIGDIAQISQELQELGRKAKDFKYGCILIPGNHDWLFETNMTLAKQICEDNGLTLLHDSGIKIEELNIWGSAWQPEFCNWAFNVPRGEKLKEKWAQIPDNTNVLITHGPPIGILDPVKRYDLKRGWYEESVGCQDLYDRIQDLKELKLHVFGHIHLGHGSIKIGQVNYINASICTEEYKPINNPYIVNV